MPLRTVLKPVNVIKFIMFYPILIKIESKCIVCQDFSYQMQSSPTLPFPLSHDSCKAESNSVAS